MKLLQVIPAAFTKYKKGKERKNGVMYSFAVSFLGISLCIIIEKSNGGGKGRYFLSLPLSLSFFWKIPLLGIVL
jgi:hypothetical protein